MNVFLEVYAGTDGLAWKAANIYERVGRLVIGTLWMALFALMAAYLLVMIFGTIAAIGNLFYTVYFMARELFG